jgi:exosortase D (VPLPA-CTERM-specific)
MVQKWAADQYNYCYLLPFVVLYLIWDKRGDLASIPSKQSAIGLAPFTFGIILFWIGELGGEHLTLLISFWFILMGLCWMYLGWEKLKTLIFPFIFILTMFPLPLFFINRLMVQLRLISSNLGTTMIQLFGLPVTRNGNIIDLGFVKLQVVEACSGLNSLISLFVLSLLMAYFFKAPFWKRGVVVLSSVPLAIFTNSLRIAVTAVLHKYFGPEVAQGFFHGFSGLVIFLVCLPLLLIEIRILKKIVPDSKNNSLNSSMIKEKFSSSNALRKIKNISNHVAYRKLIYVVAAMLLVSTLILSQSVEFREKIPSKKPLDQFPLELANWSAEGRQFLENKFLKKLDLSEYIIANYKNNGGKEVNFYIAYYESQSRGKSIHSPETCLPGSGWHFDKTGTVSITTKAGNSDKIKVSRAVIRYGSSKQIVYFWFSLRGRILNNFYQLKLYNFWDALILQRTDGALIRLITPVYKNDTLTDADARLQNFVRDIMPTLNEYIPGKELALSP